MLERDPSVKSLEGHDHRTVVIALALVLLQFSAAHFLRDSFPLAALFGVVLGPIPSLALFAVIHEASHDLCAASSAVNRFVGIAANLPLLLPLSEGFRQLHARHHVALGSPYFDVVVPSDSELALVARGGALGKLLWLACNPVFHIARSMQRKPLRFTLWLAGNAAACAAAAAAAGGWLAPPQLFSPASLLYLFLSSYSSLSIHPVNARLWQRHNAPPDSTAQASTFSFYGAVGNFFSLNLGYHVEHHDFPQVPWSRLPLLTARFPDFYASRPSHSSRGLAALLGFVLRNSHVIKIRALQN